MHLLRYILTDVHIFISLKSSPTAPARGNHESAFCHDRSDLTILEIRTAYALWGLVSFTQHYASKMKPCCGMYP